MASRTNAQIALESAARMYQAGWTERAVLATSDKFLAWLDAQDDKKTPA